MTRLPCLEALSWLALMTGGLSFACSRTGDSPHSSTGGATATSTGGDSNGGGGAHTGGEQSGNGGSPAEMEPTPKYYPVPGFEDCMHVEVSEDCEGGWCKLPPSCFVMGSPEDEWERGLNTENQVAVTLTHRIEVQQMELTRAEWTTIAGKEANGPETCTELDCPVAMVSWWDAVSAADLLSQQRGLEPCYSPVSCTGTLGVDLECTGVAEPERSVYECQGYRLPTRAEVEYAARAGTWSTWYSGDITAYKDTECRRDLSLNDIGWFCENSAAKMHLGGEKRPNSFGIYDIIGNGEEWVSEQKLGASSGGVDPRGRIGEERRRLVFGGRVDLEAHFNRTANLIDAPDKARSQLNGFRLYRTLFEDSERSKAIVEP
jgi:formylglycine-generating enzyme